MVIELSEVLAPKSEEEIGERLDRQRRNLEAGIRPVSRLGELRKMRPDLFTHGPGEVMLPPDLLEQLEQRVRRLERGQIAMQATRSLIEGGDDGPERS